MNILPTHKTQLRRNQAIANTQPKHNEHTQVPPTPIHASVPPRKGGFRSYLTETFMAQDIEIRGVVTDTAPRDLCESAKSAKNAKSAKS